MLAQYSQVPSTCLQILMLTKDHSQTITGGKVNGILRGCTQITYEQNYE